MIKLNNNPITGTFVRRQESDYRCTEQEVKRMFRDASTEGIDSNSIDTLTPEAFVRDTIKRFRQRLQNRNPEHEFNDYDEVRFLKATGALSEDGLHPTIAGLLMFGNEQALRKWRKRHLSDFRVNANDVNETLWIDRIAWEGNLLDGYFKIFPRLTEGIQIPHVIRDAERIEDTPVHIALREAFVNLLVHSDYAESDASLIIKSPSGYYFRNPGASRITPQDLYTGNRSDPRNPNLLFMFRLIGLADEAGSGIPKIIRNWKSLGFQLPNVEVGTERYEFIIQLKNAHLLTDDDRKWLNSIGGGSFDEHQQLALICARHEGKVDNERLRVITSLHPSDATRVLTGLRDKELLAKINDRRGAYYKLPSEIDGPTLFQGEKAKEGAGAESLKEDSEKFKESPKRFKETPEKFKEKLKNLKEDEEILKETGTLLNQKISRNEKRAIMVQAIVRLCELRPRTSKELSGYFNMSQAGLLRYYLNNLLQQDLIFRTGSSKTDRSGAYVANNFYGEEEKG
ncbi:MAG TPA: ATP-binding protein [Flavisolibacter sp.]|nr:ATP-binding protein [Flavisolibacter sp.]